MDQYVIYGDLGSRDAVALAAALIAKRLPFEAIEETASLVLALASRAGLDEGPYLRTPDGFVLGDLRATLAWLERVHPTPALLPVSPVRRTCARLLEDWIMAWLPCWPRRSWTTLELLGAHLGASKFLLGAWPTRPDLLLAAWLETEVLGHEHARAHLLRHAPRLVSFANDLMAAIEPESESDLDLGARDGIALIPGTVVAGPVVTTATPLLVAAGDDAALGAVAARAPDDVIPISLLPVLRELAGDFHTYLLGNHRALKDDDDHVWLDLGRGRQSLPVRPECERARVAIGADLSAWDAAVRIDVRRVLEPVGAWHVLTLPAAIDAIDPTDPRSL